MQDWFWSLLQVFRRRRDPCSPLCSFRGDMKWDGAGFAPRPFWLQAFHCHQLLFHLTLLAMSLRNLKEIPEDWIKGSYEWPSLMSHLRLTLPPKKWPTFAGWPGACEVSPSCSMLKGIIPGLPALLRGHPRFPWKVLGANKCISWPSPRVYWEKWEPSTSSEGWSSSHSWGADHQPFSAKELNCMSPSPPRCWN